MPAPSCSELPLACIRGALRTWFAYWKCRESVFSVCWSWPGISDHLVPYGPHSCMCTSDILV